MLVPRVRRFASALLAVAVASGSLVWAQRDPLLSSPAAADALASKLTAIVEHADAARPPGRRRAALRTILSEGEVNAYLRYRAASQLPVGVTEPYILVLGDGRLAARADVDLDAVRESRSRSLFDPMRLLRGRMPIEASGVLRTQNGFGQFDLESASASGIPIPKRLLQELVSYYSRTTAHPEGFDLDAPFELPSAIHEIEVRPGQAVIVQ